MKPKAMTNPFLRIFVFAAVLVLAAVAAAIGLFYYIFSISASQPEGLSLASWPQTFTDSFSVWMEKEEGGLTVEDIGIERLDEYGLWLQVLDEDGREVLSHNKPQAYPKDYSASQLAALSIRPYEKKHTIFVSSFEASGQTWCYVIGFPYAIGKHMLYYNGEHAQRLSPVFRVGICAVSGFVLIFVLVSGFWITGHLARIAKGIDSVLCRAYWELPEKGMFRQVYRELNKMDAEIRRSDRMKEDTERTRREWISNITHDLKTPLSPVRGYAELLSQEPMPDTDTVREYGRLILKNAQHTERLIDDLKLTWQMESGVMPYHPREISVIHCLREIIIDIVNDPAFRGRTIELESYAEEFLLPADPELLRRALENLIINALTHNPPQTKVTVLAESDKRGAAFIRVRDNGVGMEGEELSRLFERYYRGTSTRKKTEGSGLGLAIAKQIVVLHGGDISVKSQPGEGTEFTVFLPNPLPE